MLRPIGNGSYGRVYLARWHRSPVALKVVDYSEDDWTQNTATFEGALSSSLAHPNLVQTYNYSVRQRKETLNILFEVWIVQEWCNLGTLAHKLSKHEILAKGGFNEAVEVCTEIASAAAYVHGRGIIHGDLMPSNVLLTDRSCPKGYVTKVNDFGLARVLANGASGIDTSSIGTITYTPPEMLVLEGSLLTKKVDVYAFGVIMWQLLVDEIPYAGLQPTQIVVMVAGGLSLEIPDCIFPELRDICANCLSHDVDKRPRFDQIVRALLALSGPDETLGTW